MATEPPFKREMLRPASQDWGKFSSANPHARVVLEEMSQNDDFAISVDVGQPSGWVRRFPKKELGMARVTYAQLSLCEAVSPHHLMEMGFSSYEQ